MDLKNFKSEFDIFDEHWIHDILYKYYGDELILTWSKDNKFELEGYNTLNLSSHTWISRNGNFYSTYDSSSKKLKIYSVSVSDTFKLIPCWTLDNIDYPRYCSVDNNLIYLVYDEQLIIVDTNTREKYIIQLEYTSSYDYGYESKENYGTMIGFYLYQGHVCLIFYYGIVIIDINGDQYHQSIDRVHRTFEDLNNGLCYALTEHYIYIIDINNHKIKGEANYKTMCGIYKIKTGKVIVYHDSILFPSGKEIQIRNLNTYLFVKDNKLLYQTKDEIFLVDLLNESIIRSMKIVQSFKSYLITPQNHEDTVHQTFNLEDFNSHSISGQKHNIEPIFNRLMKSLF
jgi:hypothetical protein